MTRVGRAFAFATCLGFAGGAWAQTGEDAAAAAFEAGRTAFARKQYESAAGAFERAFRALPRGGAAYNAGLAWEAAGKRERAADDYERALELSDLDRSNESDARVRLAGLARVLGYLYVTEPVGAWVSVAHVERAPIPIRIHLPPGEHEVRIERPDGSRDTRAVTLVAGQTVKLAFAAPPSVAEPSAPAPSPPAPAPVAPARPGKEDLSPPDRRALVGWVLLGVGVAASGAAIGLGVTALQARDNYFDSGFEDADARDTAATLRTWTNVAWAGAGAAGISGVVLLVSGYASSKPAPANRSQVVLGPRTVAWSTRF